jgi:cytidylate kinase
LFARTGLTPREAKQKLTAREVSEFLIFSSLYPIDDRSNFQMPIAHLHASVLNTNMDTTKKRPYAMRDLLIFKPKDDEGHIDDLLTSEDW